MPDKCTTEKAKEDLREGKSPSSFVVIPNVVRNPSAAFCPLANTGVGRSSRESLFAANVMEIRSFVALKKSSGAFAR